jgi:hypothetical protein
MIGVALDAVGIVGVLDTCEYATWAQLAVPAAVTPVAYCPLVHCAGVDAKAVAVAALPLVLWFSVGKLVNSAALTAGNWPLPFSCTRLFADVPTGSDDPQALLPPYTVTPAELGHVIEPLEAEVLSLH